MSNPAKIEKTKDAEPAGEYQPTSVDAQKASADILITGYSRRRTEIATRRLLSGAGIKPVQIVNGVGIYLVTDEALTELRRRYSISTDF